MFFRRPFVFFIFQPKYEEMLEKYTTYTSEETSNLYNTCDSKEETTQLYALNFHLENRKNLEAMGVHVPIYINRVNDKNDFHLIL